MPDVITELKTRPGQLYGSAGMLVILVRRVKSDRVAGFIGVPDWPHSKHVNTRNSYWHARVVACDALSSVVGETLIWSFPEGWDLVSNAV